MTAELELERPDPQVSGEESSLPPGFEKGRHPKDRGVSFSAIIQKVQTMTDGGWRVSFDIPESDSEQMILLSQMREQGLQVGVIPLE